MATSFSSWRRRRLHGRHRRVHCEQLVIALLYFAHQSTPWRKDEIMRLLRPLFVLAAIGCTATTPAPATAPTTSTSRDSTPPVSARGGLSVPNADPFPSTYTPFASRTTVIRNVNIMTAAGPTIRNGSVLLQNGKIAAVGATVDVPSDAIVIDGAGKYVTPGIIDVHSHIGVYAAPGGQALSDGNEATN